MSTRDDNIAAIIAVLKGVSTTAQLVGAEQTREDLIPSLCQVIENSHEEEVLLSAVEQLILLVPYVGGVEHANVLFPPLEDLCTDENPRVRDKAAEALCEIGYMMNDAGLIESFIALLQRVVAAADTRTLVGKLTILYSQLCRHESDLVRDVAASNLVKFVETIDKSSVQIFINSIFEDPAQDDQHVRTTLKLVKMFQGIYPLRREIDAYVDELNFDIKLSIYLMRVFGTIFPQVVDALCSGSLPAIQSLTIEIVRSIEEKVLSFKSWSDIRYRVSLEDISVHIPLHRLLSMILEREVRQCYGETALVGSCSSPFAAIHDNFFGHIVKDCHPHGFASFIMEHALRINVFCAQVTAGIWRRNGDAAINIASTYHCVSWSVASPLHDLFLLQCCAALAPADQYVSRILDRFELSDYLSLNLERSNEYEPILVEEMLTLIIQVVQERRFCGLVPDECLQRDLVYKLSTDDATYSELWEFLPNHLYDEDKFNEVLQTIAVYLEPTHTIEGMYRLSKPYWKKLDLYNPCGSSEMKQAAAERYEKFCDVPAWTTQIPKWTKIYPPLHGVARIATCRTVLEIIRAVVVYASRSKTPTYSCASDGVLIAALHLLSLSLDISFGDHSGYEMDVTPLLMLASELVRLSESDNENMVSLLFLLMKICGEENDIDLSSLIKSLLKKFHKLQPELFHDVVLESASKIDKGKAIAQQRRVAIMEKMRDQRSKFSASIKSTEDIGDADSKHGSELCDSYVIPKSHATTVRCSFCRETNPNTPVSYLVLRQHSRLPSFTNRGPPSLEQTCCSAEKPTSSAIKLTDNIHLSDCAGIYLSSCGHAMHKGCLDIYVSSKSDSGIAVEEVHIFKPSQGEFLCPVCRGLANSCLSELSALPVAFSTGSPSDLVGLSALRFREALSHLQSEADMAIAVLQIGAFQSLEQTSGDRISSLKIYDEVKFSIISAEIAARSRRTSLTPNYSIDALFKELKSSERFILDLSLRHAERRERYHSLRLKGIKMLANSICSDTSVGGNVQKTVKLSETELQSCDVQYWERASDPILAHDAFSSLMWTAYCLPNLIFSSEESFLCLVHVFYVVNITQVIITSCQNCQSTLTVSGCPDSLVVDVYKVIGEYEAAQRYFHSDDIGSLDIKHAIRSLSFPYLRKCALLWSLIRSSGSGSFSDAPNMFDGSSYSMGGNIECDQNIAMEFTEIEKLEKLFKIPSLDDVLSDEIVRSVVPIWLDRFGKDFEARGLKGGLYSRPLVPFKLMLLPHCYEDLLQRYMNQHCPYCEAVPEEPLLCLLCGRLCSPNWNLCCRECDHNIHQQTCGLSFGIFIFVKKTHILLQRGDRQIPWASPDLDEHGEEGTYKKGMQLFLSEERYAVLTHLVASHNLDSCFGKLRVSTSGGHFYLLS